MSSRGGVKNDDLVIERIHGFHNFCKGQGLVDTGDGRAQILHHLLETILRSGRIADLTKGSQMALIPLAFLIAAVVRTAQGSATVALITASGILSGMATNAHLEFHPLYLGLAIGCGSKLVPWMNDAGFWIVCKLSNLTEQEALKTISPLLVVMGLTGLVVIMIGAQLFPLI